jgi:PAS domain S-box-containing protein
MPSRSSPRKPAAASSRATIRATSNGTPQSLTLDPIITLNAGGIIQSASESVERVFGWTSAELFGMNVKVLIPEPRRSALDRYLDRYRNSDRAATLQRTQRFQAVRKDGTGLQIELSMSRADLPSGAAPYFIGIIRDVSHEIDVGGDSVAERERLHQLITEQTRALATTNLRLQLADRLASLGTLAAGLGHDMNNVLLPVRARLNALESAGITSTGLRHITAVRRSIAYLQHLSDGLHFLALDPDAPGVGSEGRGTTNLAEWWRQVGTLLRKAVERRVVMRASFPAGLPRVDIAPHWLTQAMLNLIVNAGEAMAGSRRKPLIKIGARLSEDHAFVRLSVADNGRGMSPGIQRRAFDMFFTTMPRSMGTGLGLPLSRKVAIRAGGEIEIKSVAGKGTTVALVLPVAVPGKKTSGQSGAGGRLAAISVKDHRAAALITQILSSANVQVSPGKNGGPAGADIWVTEASGRALNAATRWRKKDPNRAVVLLGAPPKASLKRWSALGAAIIHPADDFGSIRLTLSQAIQPGQQA